MKARHLPRGLLKVVPRGILASGFHLRIFLGIYLGIYLGFYPRIYSSMYLGIY